MPRMSIALTVRYDARQYLRSAGVVLLLSSRQVASQLTHTKYCHVALQIRRGIVMT